MLQRGESHSLIMFALLTVVSSLELFEENENDFVGWLLVLCMSLARLLNINGDCVKLNLIHLLHSNVI